jgi:hypothetical protein
MVARDLRRGRWKSCGLGFGNRRHDLIDDFADAAGRAHVADPLGKRHFRRLAGGGDASSCTLAAVRCRGKAARTGYHCNDLRGALHGRGKSRSTASTTTSSSARARPAAFSPIGFRPTATKRVLVLEAGGRDNWIWFHIPVGYLFAIGNPRSDWCFKTEPEEGLNGRSLSYPRGKVIGGSSAINAMIYMRGQAADYDHWRQLGLAGWGWDDVLPYFKRHENHFLGESDAHGVGGELRIEAPRVHWDLLDAFRAAAEQADIKSVADFNTGDNEGCCAFHVNQKRGRRWSAATAFLKPVLNRANLRLETGCLVEASCSTAVAPSACAGGKAVNRARRAAAAKSSSPPARSARRRSCCCPASGRRSILQRARHCGRGRPAGRRRQPAGSPATAPDLQGRRHHRRSTSAITRRSGSPACSPNMRCSGAVR